MSFRLVPKSVTVNDLERRNGVILRCFSEFGYLLGALRKSSRSLSHLLMSSFFSETVVSSLFAGDRRTVARDGATAMAVIVTLRTTHRGLGRSTFCSEHTLRKPRCLH